MVSRMVAAAVLPITLIVRLAVPVLVSVIACTALVLPTRVAGKAPDPVMLSAGAEATKLIAGEISEALPAFGPVVATV